MWFEDLESEEIKQYDDSTRLYTIRRSDGSEIVRFEDKILSAHPTQTHTNDSANINLEWPEFDHSLDPQPFLFGG